MHIFLSPFRRRPTASSNTLPTISSRTPFKSPRPSQLLRTPSIRHLDNTLEQRDQTCLTPSSAHAAASLSVGKPSRRASSQLTPSAILLADSSSDDDVDEGCPTADSVDGAVADLLSVALADGLAESLAALARVVSTAALEVALLLEDAEESSLTQTSKSPK